jgi:ABC-2 type transport system permease protein
VTAQSERPPQHSQEHTRDDAGEIVPGGTASDGLAPRTAVADLPLVSPFESAGLVDVFKRRYLLKLLVQKEVQSRYQGSLLGILWSYVQPLVRFCMYFFVIGLVFGLHESVPNFAIHMFAALAGVHFFTETFSSGTRSIVRNKAIVRKMPMPREMFPVASVIVSAVNSFPQLLILFVGAVAVGWYPEWQGIGAGVLGFAVLTVLGTALALLFSAMNVFFKDFQNIVQTVTQFMHFLVPMMYAYSMLAKLGEHHRWAYDLYFANPLAECVLLMQRLFWAPTVDSSLVDKEFPPDLFERGFIMLGVSLVLVVLAQKLFTRLEGKFPERM